MTGLTPPVPTTWSTGQTSSPTPVAGGASAQATGPCSGLTCHKRAENRRSCRGPSPGGIRETIRARWTQGIASRSQVPGARLRPELCPPLPTRFSVLEGESSPRMQAPRLPGRTQLRAGLRIGVAERDHMRTKKSLVNPEPLLTTIEFGGTNVIFVACSTIRYSRSGPTARRLLSFLCHFLSSAAQWLSKHTSVVSRGIPQFRFLKIQHPNPGDSARSRRTLRLRGTTKNRLYWRRTSYGVRL